jgi:hypothetical protein
MEGGTQPMSTTLTPAEARQARDLAHQRLAFAHDAKRFAADHLAQLKADPDSSAGDILEATEALSRATVIYREAQAAAEQARRDELNATSRKYR